MLFPPFTVMILKDSHRPITIRISRLLAMIVLMLVCGVLAAALFIDTPMTGGTFVTGNDSSGSSRAQNTGAKLVATSPDTLTGDAAATAGWSLTDLSLQQFNSGDVEISFEILPKETELPLLVWLIMNPHTASAAQITVFPRSPLFRGLPVDFRNGIRFTPVQGKKLKATIAGELAGVDLERFRILAYTEAGEQVIDRTITIEQNTRM